jgi:hypothetical protein
MPHEKGGEHVPVQVKTVFLAGMTALTERFLVALTTNTDLAESQPTIDLVITTTGSLSRPLDPI